MWTDRATLTIAALLGAAVLVLVPGGQGLRAQEAQDPEEPAEPARPQTPVGVDDEEDEDPYAPDDRFADDEGDGFTESPFGNRTFLSSAIAASTGRDTGFRVRGEEVDDTVHRVAPRLFLALRPSPRTELLAGYTPEAEFFRENTDFDTVHHVAGARLSHSLTRRSEITAGASLIDGEDPSRHLGGALLLVLPRIPYERTRFHAGFEHRWPLTSLSVEVARTATDIEQGPGILTAGLDRTENVATVSLGRAMTSRLHLSGTYSYLDVADSEIEAAPGDPELRGFDSVQTATLGIDYRTTRRLALHVSGGVLDDGEELDYIAAAGVRRTGERYAFRLRYERSLFSLGGVAGEAPDGAGGADGIGAPTAALSDTTTHTVTAGLSFRFADRFRWEQLVRGARTSVPDRDALESLAASSRLVVALSQRFGAFAQVDYLDQQGSGLLGEPFSRVYFTAGLLVGLSGPRGSWGVRRAPRELETVLPYDGGTF